MVNRDVRLDMFADVNFAGRRIRLRRGGVAIRDARALSFNGQLSSFRLRNVVNSNQVTLLLFSRTDFRGAMRVYRGNTNVADLADYNDRMSSLIVVGRRLTDAQIETIRSRRVPPLNILQILQ
ncbi:hypothetical protein [Paenibacillus sp.]|uniref:hypothetical protein n=1 Tax=Paenibacillus sp. TaxID=58172 RepID=UPI0028120289|nr:hypothetical protein [Paenibacillus sp.]